MSTKKFAAGPAPVPSSPEAIRNVALVGPTGSGKSRLFDHLVAASVPGHRARDEERSTDIAAASIASGDVVVNLIDAPGHADFTGDLRAGLRAADAAVFVVSAADGVDATTRSLWHECAAIDLPRAVVITQLDKQNADFNRTLEDCRQQFGEGVQPLGIPVSGGGEAVHEVVDLMLGEIHDYSGGNRVVRPTDEAHAETFDTYRGPLIEGIIQESEDDTLMDRYLEGEDIDFSILEKDLLTAICRGSFYPVLPVSTESGAGKDVLLHLLEAAFPAPTAGRLPVVTTVDGAPGPQLTCDPAGPLVAEVIKTTSDPYVGHVSLVRVFSGTLRPDTPVHVSGHLERAAGHSIEGHHDHDEDARTSALNSPLGAELRSKETAIAGDIAVISKLATAQTADTISGVDSPLLVEPWVLPDALLPVAIKAATRADEDKLPGALQELGAQDPSLRVEHNAETGQVVLWSMGPAHLDLALERLRERFHVDVEKVPVKVALRETFSQQATVQGRHVKQSGGHGQFAVCHLTVEPLERGAGVEFHETVVGGAVPRQFIPSVEKGARAQLEKGLLAGHPVVDVRITLTDGKAHSVDSSDMAFQTAAALGLRELAGRGVVTLLEPVDLLTVTIDDEYVGAVMGDLNARRGRIQGSDAADLPGRSTITAEVPQLELLEYAITLRSLAHGTGTFTRSLAGYEVMPERLVQEHLKAAD